VNGTHAGTTREICQAPDCIEFYDYVLTVTRVILDRELVNRVYKHNSIQSAALAPDFPDAAGWGLKIHDEQRILHSFRIQ
jgi:hypothetical protein